MSQVVVARIGDRIHVRIFDAQGKKIVDKDEAELLPGPALSAFKKQLMETRSFGASSHSRLGRLDLITRAAMLAGQKSIEEEHLFQVIKFGGKGNWIPISKGTAMPPHFARLTDSEIRRLVRWLLGMARLKVIKTGLGSGAVVSDLPGINCSGDCEQVFTGGETVALSWGARSG